MVVGRPSWRNATLKGVKGPPRNSVRRGKEGEGGGGEDNEPDLWQAFDPQVTTNNGQKHYRMPRRQRERTTKMPNSSVLGHFLGDSTSASPAAGAIKITGAPYL